MALTTEEAIRELSRYANQDLYTPKNREAHRMAIEALERSRWIPVEERLPTADDADDWCQILTTDNDGLTDCYDYRTVRERPDWFSHWMPLPKAPGKDVSGDA